MVDGQRVAVLTFVMFSSFFFVSTPAKLTESIEQALGKVVHTEKTEEFFEKPIERVTDNVVDATRQNKWTGGENYPTW